MIDISVSISAGVIVSPKHYDTVADLEATIKNAVERALSNYGNSISVAVKAVAL